MIVIKRIEIKNFRSINHIILEEDIDNLNVFVGNNDVGKSNILRALNLFFNGQTEIEKPLDFWEDFNKNVQRTSGKGQYIKVVLDIELKYETDKIVRWTKQWDSKSILKVNTRDVYLSDYTPSTFSPKTRANVWLDNIKFRYVPAIKSQAYFQYLFEELHDLLNTTYSQQFQLNTLALINSIQEITTDISNELNVELNIENKLSLPSNLKKFFGTLDFTLTRNGQNFNLSGRGDGIKIRHIPIILKFMADKAKLPQQGALHVQSIWGFEEPENNLEMSQAFEIAEYFRKCSSDVQIFITTHSPAFYSLRDKQDVACFYVSRNTQDFTVASNSDHVDLDKELGMLNYVTPFLQEKNNLIQLQKAENEKLKLELSTLPKNAKVLIFTEDTGDDLELLKNYLLCFKITAKDVKIISYAGKTNFKSAVLAANAMITQFPKTEYVLFHRDMDCDGEDFYAEHEPKLQKMNLKFRLLMPNCYDLESCFINQEHIKKLYPQLGITTIEKIINDSIKEREDIAIKKLTNSLSTLKIKEQREEKMRKSPNSYHGENIDYYKIHKSIMELYESNKSRYMYGKRVKSTIEGKIQGLLKIKADIGKPSNKLDDKLLRQISADINK
jgi:predicted ATPase